MPTAPVRMPGTPRSFLLGGLILAALAAAPALAGSAVDYSSLDIRVAPLSYAQPVYPPQLKDDGIEGSVKLEMIVDVDGRVAEARIISASEEEFGEAALAAVRQWRFKPGQIKGRAVNVRVAQELAFTLDDVPKKIRMTVLRPKSSVELPPNFDWDQPPGFLGDLPQVVYPPELLIRGQKGRVVVRFVVGYDGRALQMTVREATLPEFGWAAVAALDSTIFSPAQKKGKQVLALVEATYEFDPKGKGDVLISHSAKIILDELAKPGGGAILSLQQFGAAPKRIASITPLYPSSLEQEGKSGEALVEFFIDRNGRVQLPRVVSASAPEFGAAAAQAIYYWTFVRPKKDGKPVILRAQMPFKFERKASGPAKPAEKS